MTKPIDNTIHCHSINTKYQGLSRHCHLSATFCFFVLLSCWLLPIRDAEAEKKAASTAKPIFQGDITVRLEEIAQIPTHPRKYPKTRINYLYHAGDGSRRVFVNDMRGRIYVIKNQQLLPKPFLDIGKILGDKLLDGEFEQGLAGFAFHPDYARSGQPGFGKMYTAHTLHRLIKPENPNLVINQGLKRNIHHYDVITEWSVDTTNPDRIDPASAREVLRIAQPWSDHNTGQLAFNPTVGPGNADYGLLYIAVGDGGNTARRGLAVDEDNNAQDLSTPLGSILRINPLQQGKKSYQVPADNPFFTQADASTAIWAYGLRNPQRFSWDIGGSGKMLIIDIGQENIEEVNIGEAGANYGWSIKEGTYTVNRDNPKEVFRSKAKFWPDGLVNPVAQYGHDQGKAIAGGFVYRGAAIPELKGAYVFGDMANGRIYYLPQNQLKPGKQASIKQLKLLHQGAQTDILNILGGKERADLHFGMDERGELYVLTKQDGIIRKLVPINSATAALTGMRAGNGAPVTGNSSQQPSISLQSPGQDEMMTNFWLIAGAGILVFLAMLGYMLFLNRSRLFPSSGIDTGSMAESYRYVSKISLCTLIFDALNGIITVNYGKKQRRAGFDEIESFEILVNSDSLIRLDRKNSEVFDAETEHSLRVILDDLQKQQMTSRTTRSIEIKINAIPTSALGSNTVNFYFREGDRRLSAHSFAKSVDDVVQWSRLLDSVLHAAVTEDAEPETMSEKQPVPVITAEEKPDVDLQPIVQSTGKAAPNVAPALGDGDDLVDELARLSALKAQGFLSDDEFRQAKAKIINR